MVGESSPHPRTLVTAATATLDAPPLHDALPIWATFTNQAGGTVVLANDSILRDGGGVATNGFVNRGTLQRTTSSGTASITVALLNSGTVSVQTGTLALGGNGTSSGTFGTGRKGAGEGKGAEGRGAG